MLFASAGLGADGIGYFVLLTGGCAILWLLGFATAGGLVLVKRGRGRRWLGVLFLATSLLSPLGCCLGPGILFRTHYGREPLGRYPSGVIEKGMTADEVRSKLGPPHKVEHRSGQEEWYYWIDVMGVSWFCVSFDEHGRVVDTGGD
jgi:hypothetical protein